MKVAPTMISSMNNTTISVKPDSYPVLGTYSQPLEDICFPPFLPLIIEYVQG